MERYEFTPMLGPAEHLPVGSVEWSQRISNQLQIATDTVSYDVEHLVARSLTQVLSADPKPWRFGLKSNLSRRPMRGPERSPAIIGKFSSGLPMSLAARKAKP